MRFTISRTAALTATGLLVASGLAMGATPAAASTPQERPGVSGTTMTGGELAALACTKGGIRESTGWAHCTGTRKFKVQVWCTWAGQGISTAFRTPYNWAQCNRGSVNAVDVIWAG